MRTNTRKVYVGNVQIGGQDKIVIQTMLTCPPRDISSTMTQIASAAKLGAELVRVSVSNEEDADALKTICANSALPLIADIHFDYRLAIKAIDNGIAKIRINPGTLKKDEILELAQKCKEKKIPIRVGINGGSVEKAILEKYKKVTAAALVESAKEQVKKLEDVAFYDIVISIKTSNVEETIQAYRLAAKELNYPLHLGLSEAGPSLISAIKSSCALAPLIHEGIGDTIRISVTGTIEEEIAICKEILYQFGLYSKPNLISCPTCGRTEYPMQPIAVRIAEFLSNITSPLTVAVMGCIVNGPGEAKGADIGIAGGKNGKVAIFKKGEVIKTVSADLAEDILKQEIIALDNLLRNK